MIAIVLVGGGGGGVVVYTVVPSSWQLCACELQRAQSKQLIKQCKLINWNIITKEDAHQEIAIGIIDIWLYVGSA